ncbi:hypothetical protein METBIDRAFT_43179 [Metschnikowia bicuspidata var. bicuspidata NRRL YB-4993]|uniref:Centrosomin N-terminal motif 1 domain-containing protein n=1 Tax=Metschnikowia bicuspidata var. bicuspidata NRRL YB-4993 TaxID=869754 RepID=A0A1A0H8Z4_9ASCO|nr:hypothetical protein METBIDRAFT_43179 [Metschnikowia bicuspidata var. bicuspidata NRRL YB-4993]OBA20594.1 hypothetical protein METBIDRAFT_43179 [Metschnikowia bicuspidata var. bicuspidata NRRL YB-4993]
MFSLGRLPRLSREKESGLEFVPIGQRVVSPRKPAPSSNPRVRLTADKINNTHIDSSFDETTQDFGALDADAPVRVSTGSRLAGAGWSSRGNFASTLEQRSQAVDGGQSSIQSLQADSQQLKSENYNLKVEVATLKQFLKQTPPETRELVLQNAALKQELIKTQNELEQVRSHAESAPRQDREHSAGLDSLKRLYRESLEEKDQEIRRLQRQIAELSHVLPLPPQIPQELLDKMEFLQNENQALLRQLEGASASSSKTQGQLQGENNELRLDLHRAKAQLAELPADAVQQIDHLRKTNDTLLQKMRTVSNELQQAEAERDSMQMSLRNLQLSHEVADLKLKLKRADAAQALLAEEKWSDVQRLQRKLDSLLKEIKEKDRDEYNLREQVRSLMEERNKAFDNQSTVNHYQGQIDALREKEKTLMTDNLELKDEIAKLQDELYSRNIDSSRAGKLKQENLDLLDRLDFYEKEYALTQEAMEATEAELEALRTRQKQDDARRHSLETELETVRTQLRRVELSESRKYNESAYMELEEKHRKREEADHCRMTLQIERLNAQVRELEQQLDSAKQTRETFPSLNSYEPTQESRLKVDLRNKEFELQERQRDYSKLQNVLKDKEDLIDALEERIRKLNKDYRTDFSAEDRYRETLQKLQFDHESELLAVLLERDRLQNEIKHYKLRLEKMMEDDDTQIPTGANSVTIALLETQLEELRRKNHELMADAERASAARFESTSREADEYRSKIRDLRFALNDAQQEKSDLETTRDALESDLSLLRSEKSRFETRNRSLSQELTKNARNCTRLANKVQDLESQIASLLKAADDTFKAQKSNIQLQNQVDQLGARLATANLSSQPNQMLNVTKSRLQENELKYFKAKLFELQTRYMDLAMINSYMVSSIRSSYESCKDDLVKMSQSGVYPDYSALNRRSKKVTFKVLATFVLSMVRMKRRTEKAKVREGKLMRLRSDIERDRITLLVEK